MGCASSKASTEVAVADVYRPPPTSVALFDVSAVEEPWLIATGKVQDDDDVAGRDEEPDDAKKPNSTVVPLPLLEKLDAYELAPASWSEVSKALEDLKPTLNSKPIPAPAAKKPSPQTPVHQKPQQPPPVHSSGETDKKLAPLPPVYGNNGTDKKPPPPELTGRSVVKENAFVLRDRENQSKDGAAAPRWRRRDPFEGYQERRPPGPAGGGVVLYTTTLRGVRRTFEDCERARQTVEAVALAVGGVAVEERDVSLHGEYLRELKELAGEDVAVPKLFVLGRYIGRADECVQLADTGRLREMMRWVKMRGEAGGKDGRGCEGCGGARFVPCWECGGSCKVVVAAGDEAEEKVERCGKCNENGLMLCPLCH